MSLKSQRPPTGLDADYRHIRLDWDEDLRALHLRMNVRPVQCYSLTVMAEIKSAFDRIAARPGLVRHLVVSSDVPGVFNFGGDLALFVLLVRARDLRSLKMYGRRCIELVWWIERAAQLDILTSVMVQGDTLGGGLESVLAFHTILFERDAVAGFPEVLFNLFPGMGAWQFAQRRAGFVVANEMVRSGRLYAAPELLKHGLIDHVVEPGQGERAIAEVVRQMDPRHRGVLAALRARALATPVTLESLLLCVDLWAETALRLTDRDLRLMERLARAQVRKARGGAEGALEEIKRIELDTAWGEERQVRSEWAELAG